MSKKNIKVWVVVIISLQFLVLCSVMVNGNAWKNGYVVSGNVTETEINNWRAGRHYGTHDWIAEAAIEAIRNNQYAQEWKDVDGLDFWTPRRIIIFLIGTEAPDMKSDQVSMTLNGVPVSGKQTSGIHHIWWYEDSSPSRMTMQGGNVLNTLDGWVKLAREALIKHKCDLAAFYMGAASHFITDLSNYLHTISPDNIRDTWNDPRYNDHSPAWQPNPNKYTFGYMLQDLHNAMEKDILSYTDDREASEFFYSIDFKPNGIMEPRKIAIETAFNSRFDNPASYDTIHNNPVGLSEGLHNALWMFHRSYTVDLIANKPTYKPIIGQNDVEGIQRYEQVQYQLKLGIQSVAKMLDYFGYVWNTETDKTCEGCVTETPPDDSMRFSNKMMIGVAIFIFIGIASTFFQFIMIAQVQSSMRKSEKPGLPI